MKVKSTYLTITSVALFCLLSFSLFSGLKLGIPSDPSSSFHLIVSDSNLGLRERSAANSLIKALEKLIPPSMKGRLNFPITVAFEKGTMPPNLARSGFSNLRINPEGYTITLNSVLLPEILKGPENSESIPNPHRNYFTFSMAVVIHHLAILYDRALQDMDHGGSQGGSNNAQYWNLAYWRKQWSPSHPLFSLLPNSEITLRVPDAAENLTLQEHFAVNLEYFLLDPDYSCRRPALSQYLETLLNHRPKSRCQVNYKVPIFDENLQFYDLDPNRIYEIDYFVASPGKEIDERWGHAMLRLIICAPGRDQVGPDCRKDLSSHLTLSHDADQNGSVHTVIPGLTGKFPFRVAITRAQNTINHYTQNEFRSLTSIPLQLTWAEKQKLLDHILEKHWETQGRFYFITDNCTTEIISVLGAVLGSDRIKNLSAKNPSEFLEQLKTQGFLKENQEVFPSAENALKQAFALSKQASIFPWNELESYLTTSTAEARQKVFDLAFAQVDSKLIRALSTLERTIQRMKERELDHHILNAMSQISQNSEVGLPGVGLIDAYRKSKSIFIPYNKPKKGYGIPQLEDFDFDDLRSKYIKYKSVENQLGHWLRTSKWVQDQYPELLQEMKQLTVIGDNLARALKH